MTGTVEKAVRRSTGNAERVFATLDQRSLGDFAVCVAKARGSGTPSGTREQVEKRLRHVYESSYVVEKAPMSEASGQVGGYTVPVQTSMELMRDVCEDSIFWPRAFVQPMATNNVMLPIPDPTRSASVPLGSNMFGGMILQWRSSQTMSFDATTNPGETEPTFSQVELGAQELCGFLTCSNDLAMDSPGMDAFLRRFIPRGVANATDQAFFRGPGPGSGPTGLVGAGCTITVTRAGGNAITQADLSNMYQRLLPGSERFAVWALSPTALGNITAISGGIPGMLIMLPGSDGSSGLLMGKPFYKTEKLPDLGTPGDVLLFDPSLYVIGHRGLYLDFTDQAPAQWQRAQCVWRVVWRGDGAPMLKGAVTLANQSSTTAAMAVQLSA